MRQNICNYVHDAEIWKDHVRTEHTASKCWNSKWGYTTNVYNRLHKSLTGKNDEEKNFFREYRRQENGLVKSRKLNAKHPTRKVELPPISQALPPSITVKAKQLKRNREKAPAKFPKTTSDQVGWLAKDNKAQTYGQANTRFRGKWTLYKQLGWPIESTV